MSKQAFQKIEWQESSKTKEPDWRPLNQAINDQKSLEAINAPIPSSVHKPIEAFQMEMKQHEQQFASFEACFNLFQAEFDRKQVASAECREALNSQVLQMLSMTQEAGLRAGLDDFKRHSPQKGCPETIFSEVSAPQEETGQAIMKDDCGEGTLSPSTCDCEICRQSEGQLGTDPKATGGGSRHRTSSICASLTNASVQARTKAA
jgi:hypothetical protein